MPELIADEFGELGVGLGGQPTPCELVTGPAGCGKTYTIKQRIAEDPTYAVLAASTGIAGVNLSATTIHSLLGFYDTESLRDARRSGSIQRRLRAMMKDGVRRVVIDEVSMISADVLDLLIRCFDEVNEQPPKEATGPIGIVLVGDFCQLPPIPDRPAFGRRAKGSGGAPWAFRAECWPRFVAEGSLLRLSVNYRQSDPEFLRALNAARAGEGSVAAASLVRCGVQFHSSLDPEFDGTTILSKNDEVDRYNADRLSDLIRESGAKPQFLNSRRWGEKQPKEWERNVPQSARVCVGAYVMILANARDGFGGPLIYANGDCGHIVSFGAQPGTVQVRLVRTGEIVNVAKVIRDVVEKERPAGWQGELDPDEEYYEGAHRGKRGYVSAQVQYFPLRLAWASTVHKSQGLTLDRVQVDYRQGFFGHPAMVYTALSRCRTPEGLRLVGDRETFVARCRVDAAVRGWL